MLARRVWRDRSLDAAGMVAKATSAAEFKMRVAGDGELQSSEFYRVRYSGALRQLQDAVFSEVYDDYFGQSSWITTADYDRFFSMLEVARASNVLDVASGWGAPALRLASRTGCSVVRIEINHEAVASATALAEQLDLAARVRFELRDADQPLSFPDGAFDAICCFAALHLFPEPLAALDAMARVLAPRGRLAILTSARAPLTPAPVGALIGAATGLRVFGREEITRALEERGFEDVRRRVSGLAQFVGARRTPA